MPSPLYTSVSLSPFMITTTLIIFCGLPSALALPHIYHDVMTSTDALSCTFDLSGYSFDLCSLADIPVLIVEASPQTSTSSIPIASSRGGRRRFKLSFPSDSSRPVVDNERNRYPQGALDLDHVRCPDIDKTGICVQDTSNDEAEDAYRALGWGTVASPTVKSIELTTDGNLGTDGDSWEGLRMLSVSFHPTGESGIAPQIDLVCSKSDSEGEDSPPRPTVLEHLSGRIFRWRTPNACPAGLSNSADNDDFRILEDEAGGKESQDGDDNTPGGEGSDLKSSKPDWSSISRRWIAGMICIVGFVVLGGLVISSPRARYFILEKVLSLRASLGPIASQAAMKLRPLTRVLKLLAPMSVFQINLPFRQGDSRLVQWAEEDMSLQEDFMVNGSGAYELDGEGWNGDNLDEYIPLTLSPKSGRTMKSYGSTPVREGILDSSRPIGRGLFTPY